MSVISEEIVEKFWLAANTTCGNHDFNREDARRGLTAVLPDILEEAAKVAENGKPWDIRSDPRFRHGQAYEAERIAHKIRSLAQDTATVQEKG